MSRRPTHPRAGPPSRVLAALAALLLMLALPAGAAERVALVIGNSAYAEAPLKNPVNDARAMAVALEGLGFKVVARFDADRNAMEKAVIEFASALDENSTALFYYAGHGVQAGGRNYLLPVDARVDSERALRFAGLDVSKVLEEMEAARSKINLVVLDACRNNPFEHKVRGGGRGLAAIDAAQGTLIAYATAPGSVAADGSGSNGLYTEEFLKALRQPGLKAEEVFKRVRVAVSERSSGAQVPWESSSLTGDFVFNQGGDSRNLGVAPVKKEIPIAAPASGGDEAVYWASVKDSGNKAELESYLRRYPGGTYGELARIKLEELDRNALPEACRNFSGEWIHDDKLFCRGHTMTFKAVGEGQYSIGMSSCFGTSGIARLTAPRTLELKWRGIPCSGTTVIHMDKDCRAATGVAVPDPGLFCGGQYPITLEKQASPAAAQSPKPESR